MASSTRLGRILRSEGTSSTRCGNASAKVKNPKDTPTSCSTAIGKKNRLHDSTAKDARSSVTFGSAATDLSNLSKYSRESPAKKITASSSSSRKSERLENEAPSNPFDNKSEKLERKRPYSPLRRSARIEKIGVSSTPGSQKLNETSSPSLKKKKIDDKNGKIAVASTESQSKDEKLDAKSSGVSERKAKSSGVSERKAKSSGVLERKARLDARRYRAMLQPNKEDCSNDDDMHLYDESTPKGNRFNSASSNSKKFHEGLDECNGRKEDKHGECSVRNGKEVADGSISGSRELAELSGGRDSQRESVHLSWKGKNDEFPTSEYRGNPSKFSLVGSTTKDNGSCVNQGEINGVDNTEDADGVDTEELAASGLVASSCDGKSFAFDTSQERGVNVKCSKNAQSAADLDFDVSVIACVKDICNTEIFKTDVTSDGKSLALDTGDKDICNPEISEVGLTSSFPCHPTSIDIKKHNRCNNESFEIVYYPCEIEAPATPSHGNCVKEHPMPEATEHSAGSEKDRWTFEDSEDIHPFENYPRVAHQAKSSVAAQSDNGTNACVICKHPGQLLCCEGKSCKRSYHLSCISPPLRDIPPCAWLCHLCVKKKVEKGVYSVSEGIESIWGVKGMPKHYFVKYKGLAHVHNQIVPESQILLEAPMLVAKFDRRHQKEKATGWKQEWTVPHRILQKRQVMHENLADEYFAEGDNKFSYCYYEWLVKWKGLGYEYATWELGNSPFLCSSDATVLIRDFENRHEEAKKKSDPLRADKIMQVKKSPFQKLTQLPSDCPAGLDDDHLNSVNQIFEFWHKYQNAVFIDQERIIKSILFISALKSHTFQPVLVISTVNSLSLWETEFIRLAPSMNVVIYTGSKDVRKLIRALEFYEEGGCVMFQVLLSHPDAIVEDLDALDCICWESLIIDDCQNLRVSKHLQQFKDLSTEFRLLLLTGQLKDNIAEYLNLLSLLESHGKEKGSSSLQYDTNDSAGALTILKEKLRCYLVYERKLHPSKFLEYWVPVRLSNVQIEQYCSTLLSNSITLRLCSKVDQVGALRNILISARKCCDHPYLVGRSLQNSLTKDLPFDKYLDIGVKACGKLHLLDKLLHDIKTQGLRVLILFQSSGGAGRDSVGDILDDFLRQRFGEDSYERIDGGLVTSKKVAALNKFNDKAKGRFVFLLENRACLPSIKLSSVDAVVIFNSDWNPLNDLRALQRIHIDSQFEHVKVFRLYTSCTVEEKVLILAKQDMILDSNIQNISPSNSHLLLSWGAFHLFDELDEFHQHDNMHDYTKNSIDKCFLNDSMLKFLNDVLVELVKEFPGKAENNSCRSLLLIKAQQNGTSYSRNICLVGERDGISSLDKNPPVFWSNLLENRYPKWRFISEPSQRIRRKAERFEMSIKAPEVENDEVRKKRRKLTMNTVDPISLQSWLEVKTKGMGKNAKGADDISPSILSQPSSIFPKTTRDFRSNMPKDPETYGSKSNIESQCMPCSTGSLNHATNMFPASSISDTAQEPHKFLTCESEGRHNARGTLYLCLKPELTELCNTLRFPDAVKGLGHILLEYVMNNHYVNQEPVTILQAFKLSLCWRAASFLKHKVDHKESLALAKKYLNYTCNEEQADSVYLKLRMLKKKFSQPGALRHQGEPNSLETQLSASRKEVVNQHILGGTPESASSYFQESAEIIEVPDGQQAPVAQPVSKAQQNFCLFKDSFLVQRDLIDTICLKREEALLLKQQVELADFHVHAEEEKMMLKSEHDDQLELIRSTHTDYTIRNEKIKLLNQIFSKRMTEFYDHIKCQRRILALMQEGAKNKERKIRERWVEEAEAGTLAESFDNLLLTESGFRLEEFKVTEQVEACDGQISIMSVSRTASDQIIENQLEFPSNFLNARVEDVQPLQPIGTSTEIFSTVLRNVDDVESIEPIRTYADILGLQSDMMCNDIGAYAETLGPQSDLMCNEMITTVPGMCNGTIENHFDMPSTISIARVKDVQGLASEIMETVHPNMIRVESIESNDTPAQVLSNILPPEDGDITKDSGPLVSESDVINVLVNLLDAMHIVSLTETTSLPMETETPDCQSNNMVSVVSGELNRISAEDGHISRETDAPPFQIKKGGNGTDEILVGSTVVTAAATIDRNVHESEDNHDGTYLRSSLLQNLAPTKSCCVNTVSSNLVSSASEHGSSLQPTTPVETSQVEPTARHTNISNSILLPVHLVDKFSAENDQGITTRSVRNEGELDAEGRNSTALAPQYVHTVLPEQTLEIDGEVHPDGITYSSSQTDVRALHPIVTETMHADRSNQLMSQSVVHLSLFSANMLPERTHSDGNVRTGAPQELESHLQILPMAGWVHPQALHPDPLKNELTKLQKQIEFRSKMHEDKKQQLKLEREQEVEKVCRKYDVLLEDAESGYHQDKKTLDTIFNKVLVNQILAEELRAKFTDRKGGTSNSFQGPPSSSMQQFPQTSHEPRAQMSSSAPSSACGAPISANQPPLPLPIRATSTLNLPYSGSEVPAGSSITPGLVIHQTPNIHTTYVRAQFNPNLHGGNDVRASASRAPAPHLRRFRPSCTSMLAPPILPPRPTSHISSQHHPHSNLGEQHINQ